MLIDFTTFLIRLQKPHVITGLILAILGLATILLAKRIASVARKEQDRDKPIESNNRVLIIVKVLGLTMLLVSLIIMVFE
jgi:Na+/H+ antiporter NhaD/arsenite permease-like protein